MRAVFFESILTGLALLLIAGCSGGGPGTIPVSGVVTVEGREFPQVCRVFFLPVAAEGPKRSAVAQTGEDGSYSVKAFRDSEGLLPGTYKVNVQYLDLKPGANPERDSSWITHEHSAGELVVDADSDDIEHNIAVPLK